VSRQTPAGDTHPRVLHYFAAFADSAEAGEGAHVDYLLESSDEVAESLADPADAPAGAD
jgi:hypothetical protein